MSRWADDNFRLEIPTPRGTIVVIGPALMSLAEIGKATVMLAALLPLMPWVPERDEDSEATAVLSAVVPVADTPAGDGFLSESGGDERIRTAE